MKKILFYLFSFLIFIGVIDYLLFYSKIDNYKSYIGFNKNLIVLTGGNHRIKKTLEVFFKIKNPNKKLFISGVGPGFNNKILKNLTRDYNDNEKVISCCIKFEGKSKNTFSNAEESLKWVKSENINSFMLLTSNYHMPRAMLEFKNVSENFTITPYILIDESNTWYSSIINLISEYFKLKIALVRINFL